MTKTLFCVLLALAIVLCSAAAVDDTPMNGLTIKTVKVDPTGSITVRMANDSTRPIRIWKESNSWGAARWRVFRVREGRLETFFQNPDQTFTRNVPGFDEIAVGAHIEKHFDLNGRDWRRSEGTKASFQAGGTVIVIYDVPKQFGWADPSTAVQVRKMNVWYGVTAALTIIR